MPSVCLPNYHEVSIPQLKDIEPAGRSADDARGADRWLQERLSRGGRFFRYLALCISVFAVVSAGAQSTAVSGPTMKGVADVLQGKTILLRQSDAAVLTSADPYNSFGYAHQYIYPFNSDNSMFTEQPVLHNSGNFGPPAQSYSVGSVPNSAAAGRMFNNGNDVIVSLGANACGNPFWAYSYFNPVTNNTQFDCLNSTFTSSAPTVATKVLMGNFKGNNLVIPLLFVQSNWGSHVQSQMNFLDAGPVVDQINLKGGSQPYTEDKSETDYPVSSTLVAGDFNGDGIDEIAVLDADYKTIRLFKVALPSLTLTQYGKITLKVTLQNGTLAAGRFDNTGNVYLAAVGPDPSNKQNAIVLFIDPSTSPATQTPTSFAVDQLNSYIFSAAYAQSAPIENFASSSSQQLVLGLSYEYGSWHNVQIGNFDSARNYHMLTEEAQNGCLFGLQVGNFNNQTSGGSNFPDSNINPNLQILELQNDRQDSSCVPPYADKYVHLAVSNIDATTTNNETTYSINQVSNLVPNIGPYSTLINISLLTGDFQGRSIQLGAPEKVTLHQHTQPNLVLTLPPMHVDWVNPNELPGSPLSELCDSTSGASSSECILNLTVRPNGRSADVTKAFTSDFSTAQSTASSSQTKTTSSWGLAVKTTRDTSVSFGQAGVGSATASLSLAAGYGYNNVSSQYDNQYSNDTTGLSASTAFDDLVLYTTENQNIYNYPILGEKDANGNPLYVTYSVPSSVQRVFTGGATAEWYQPVHEPGNILSYASSPKMLADSFLQGTITAQTAETCFNLSDSVAFQSVTWTNRKATGTSTGSSNQVSADVKVSVSAKVTPSILTGGVGGSLNESIDVSGSHGWGSLEDSATTTSTTNAFQIVQPRFRDTSIFGYAYEGIVYGYSNNTPPLQDTSKFFNTKPDISTSGPLYADFAVNPVQGNQGLQCNQPGTNWWKATYTKPDVGFNHPLRWDAHSDNTVTFRSFNPKVSAFNQRFYHMKGLFITTDVNDAKNPGTTVSAAPAGQPLRITARVYNFSLVSTRGNAPYNNSEVHVRFYGAQKNQNKGDFVPNSTFVIPASQGNADYVIDNIPGFNDGSGDHNWALPTVTLDTTNMAGQTLVFWVVTWIQDKTTGAVLSEMPGHGIMTPANFTNKSFASISDIPIEAYSNNVGLYGTYSGFQVLPPVQGNTAGDAAVAGDSLTAAGGSTAAATGALAGIQLGLPSTLPFDEDSVLTAKLTSEAAFDGGLIQYYDGNPKAGGQLIDVQTLPSIPADSSEVERTYYRPRSCGARTLYAVSNAEGFNEVVGRLSTRVTLNPAATLDRMMANIHDWQLQRGVKVRLLSSLEETKDKFLFDCEDAGLESLERFRNLVQRLVSENPDALINREDTLLTDISDIQGCRKNLDLPRRRGR